jgi:Ca2+:H+ antiporter
MDDAISIDSIESANYRQRIIICTYRAAGWQFVKYTVDGINIVFINLTSMIFFTIADYFWIGPYTNYTGIGQKSVIFASALLSTVPLSYFIGMGVSSITVATESVAIGSVVNAAFGSVIEIILYIFALGQGKVELVQGAIIGSMLLGLLALPGVSMVNLFDQVLWRAFPTRAALQLKER